MIPVLSDGPRLGQTARDDAEFVEEPRSSLHLGTERGIHELVCCDRVLVLLRFA